MRQAIPWWMVLLLLYVSAGCSGTQGARPATSTHSVILVASERSPLGGRLVWVRSDGARQSVLTTLPPQGITLDRSPVYSTDGSDIVFVSNRERESLAQTSLWLISGLGGSPIRLTEGDHNDLDPRFASDGWLYFCSDRNGSFDLYRAKLDSRSSSFAEIEQITNTPQQVRSPSISANGKRVVFMSQGQEGQSALWTVEAKANATPQRLSEGPMDMTPAWGPGQTIAFASRASGRSDADLFLMEADGTGRRILVDAPKTDETGPRWSVDGRFVFAIGMYRSARDGKPLLGSVVLVDVQAAQPVLRALHDPAAVESRVGLAVAPKPLDATLLSQNPEYETSLRQVLLQAAVANEARRTKSAASSEQPDK